MAKVFVVDRERLADIKVFNCAKERDADLLFFTVEIERDAKGDTLWHFVDKERDVQLNIFDRNRKGCQCEGTPCCEGERCKMK